MRRPLPVVVLVLGVAASMGCGEDEAAPSEFDVGTNAGLSGRDTGNASLSPDARVPAESTHEITFVLNNGKEESIFIQQGPDCLHRGPGWVFVESRVERATKFLTSPCPDCSCDAPSIGFGCSCSCSEDRQSSQTDITELPPGGSTSWTWSGDVYGSDSGDTCETARPPPAHRLRARFCWRSTASGPEGCWTRDFDYGDSARTFTATIRAD